MALCEVPLDEVNKKILSSNMIFISSQNRQSESRFYLHISTHKPVPLTPKKKTRKKNIFSEQSDDAFFYKSVGLREINM